MQLDAGQRRRLIEAVARAVIDHADELTALDPAIGDGDHGANMKRGFEAVLADLDALAEKPLPEALKAAGTQLVMKVGGASGPLYGTLFMSLGKALPDAPDRAALRPRLHAAIDAVKARGKVGCRARRRCSTCSPPCRRRSPAAPIWQPLRRGRKRRRKRRSR